MMENNKKNSGDERRPIGIRKRTKRIEDTEEDQTVISDGPVLIFL